MPINDIFDDEPCTAVPSNPSYDYDTSASQSQSDISTAYETWYDATLPMFTADLSRERHPFGSILLSDEELIWVDPDGSIERFSRSRELDVKSMRTEKLIKLAKEIRDEIDSRAESIYGEDE